MAKGIRPYRPTDRDDVVALSLRAWAPVFVSIEKEMDPEVYAHFHPDGWEVAQEASVGAVCDSDEHTLFVVDEGEGAVGFVAVTLDRASQMGEIYMIAVDPGHQRRGLARALTDRAVDFMRENGMAVAMVETGFDPGHAPARRTYEAAGFGLLGAARYFRKI